MTPGARIQAAIDILDLVFDSQRNGGPAADQLIRHYFSSRRYAGSKDRRAVRAHVFDVLRAYGSIVAVTGEGHLAIIDHEARALGPVGDEARAIVSHFATAPLDPPRP